MTFPDEPIRAFGRRRERHEITIAKGGRVRAFRLDLGKLALAAGALGVFTLAYVGATAYLFFRDDILSGAISRQVHQARAYEDRVAALRAEIDRINGRQLMDQEAFEGKIDSLLKRQAALGDAQARVGALVDRAAEAGVKLVPGPVTGSITPLGQTMQPTAPSLDEAPPPPLDTDRFATPLRSSWFAPLTSPALADVRAKGAPVAVRIAEVERTLDRFEKQQSKTLTELATLAEGDADKAQKALRRVGFKVAETPRPRPKPSAEAGVGGPYVPAPGFDMAERAESAVTRLGEIRRAAATLPLGRPFRGDLVETSGFGVRMDPFLGMPATHTGVDFRAELGEPVRVTGPGTVLAAGAMGGYGLAVDVDHGNGIVTRYGHMSKIVVDKGQKLKVGDLVGLAGSTGRSTGTHLHYETRVAGEPVDPTRWLEAGRELGF